MKKTRWLIYTSTAILLFIIFYFDIEIVKFFSSLRNAFTTEILFGLTFLSSELIIFLFLTTLFLWQERKRRWILPLWLSLFLSSIIGIALKLIIHRFRPFQQGIVSIIPILERASYYAWDFSMPSIHAIIAFAALPIIILEFPRFKYFWVALASLIALSRVYFGLHFLSDIVVGSIIGLTIGTLMVKLEKNNSYGKKFYKKIFRKKK